MKHSQMLKPLPPEAPRLVRAMWRMGTPIFTVRGWLIAVPLLVGMPILYYVLLILIPPEAGRLLLVGVVVLSLLATVLSPIVPVVASVQFFVSNVFFCRWADEPYARCVSLSALVAVCMLGVALSIVYWREPREPASGRSI